MEDLQTAYINLPPGYLTSHKKDIKNKLSEYLSHIKKEYDELKLQNKFLFETFNFDETGEANILLDSMSELDRKLLEEIKNKHSYETFFKIKKDKNGAQRICNRQQIYYSVKKQEERIYQSFKTFVFLDTNLLILQELNKKDFVSGSFIIASLLDDIRYKLILLYEDVLFNKIKVNVKQLENFVEEGIWIFYSYILGRPQTTIGHSQLIVFATEVREFIATQYLNNFGSSSEQLRHYKEGDIPSDNLMFIDKLKKSIPKEKIDFIIGIPFGGIELPYLVKRFIYPNAEVRLIRVSDYSKKHINECEQVDATDYKSKNVLIVDDGITTGRSIDKVIKFLTGYCDNVYFACIYFSGPKRFGHMQMKEHGGYNIEQLKKCCVLNETNYTASVNKVSYTNRNGNFDKTKIKIEAKADIGRTLFDVDNITNSNSSSTKVAETKKVFIACSQRYITDFYARLKVIRDSFNAHPDYEVLDDWIVNRVSIEGGVAKYKEVEGRHVPFEAIRDINNSDIVILFCPGPSTYVSLLFLACVNVKKEVWIYYSRKEETKGFEFYPQKKLIQISKYRDSLPIK